MWVTFHSKEVGVKEEICTGPALVGAVVLSLLLGGLVLAIYPGWPVLLEKIPPQKEPVDYVTWVSAIAGSLAVVVAVWIALHQSCIKRNEEQVKAQLIAAHISSRLHVVLRQLKSFSIYSAMDHMDSETPMLDEFYSLKAWFQAGFYKPSQEDLLGLVPLPSNASFRIAKAYDVLDFLEGKMVRSGRLEKYFTSVSPAEQLATLKSLYEDVQTASDYLTPAVGECIKAARIVTKYPSSAELFGPRK